MNYINSLPFYLVDRQDAVVAQYKDAIEDAVLSNDKILTLTWDAKEVANMQTDRFEDLLGSLQHFYKSIPLLVNKVQFRFLRAPGSEEVIPEQEWKANPLYHRFFHEMFKETPYIIFFTHDFDVRLYMVAGDYTKGNSISVGKVESPKGWKVRTTAGATTHISKRLVDAGITMLLYCHGCKFDAKATIVNQLNEYLIAPEFKTIYKQYERDVAQSLTLNTKGSDGDSSAGQSGSAAA